MNRLYLTLIAAGFFVAFLSAPFFLVPARGESPSLSMHGTSSGAEGAISPAFRVGRGGRISVRIANLPLNQVLRLMSERGLFDISGALPSDEAVSAVFLDLPLDEALKKLMRGYNYVLFREGTGQKPLLLLMGKAVRPNPAQQRVRQRTPVRLPVNQAPDPKTYYVPPTIVEQQPAAKSPRLVSSRQPSGDQSHRPREVLVGSPASSTEKSGAISGLDGPPGEVREPGLKAGQKAAQAGPAPEPENTGVKF